MAFVEAAWVTDDVVADHTARQGAIVRAEKVAVEELATFGLDIHRMMESVGVQLPWAYSDASGWQESIYASIVPETPLGCAD